LVRWRQHFCWGTRMRPFFCPPILSNSCPSYLSLPLSPSKGSINQSGGLFLTEFEHFYSYLMIDWWADVGAIGLLQYINF
jgi:hypothetical protein